LAACGEDQPVEPTSSTTVSPLPGDSSTTSASNSSSSSSSSTSDGVAPLPEAATKQTKEGAIAFNEFYQLQMGEALKTANSATLRSYAKDCAVCDGLADVVDDFKKRRVHASKNPYSVSGSTARARDDGGYRVEMKVENSAYREVGADGAKGPNIDPISLTIVSDTQWHDGSWQIRDLVRVK
ncbi:DUF6318 family protein, partial [Janibacter limosus]|uniref:DUF6318 family protein n=1 Tax=Janibacter limosus TaxID=53458 RepID=UPI000A70D90A